MSGLLAKGLSQELIQHANGTIRHVQAVRLKCMLTRKCLNAGSMDQLCLQLIGKPILQLLKKLCIFLT